MRGKKIKQFLFLLLVVMLVAGSFSLTGEAAATVFAAEADNAEINDDSSEPADDDSEDESSDADDSSESEDSSDVDSNPDDSSEPDDSTPDDSSEPDDSTPDDSSEPEEPEKPVPQLTAVTATPTSVTIKAEEKKTITLQATIVTGDASEKVDPLKDARLTVSFTSKDAKIAEVSASGEVKGVKPGQTSITISVGFKDAAEEQNPVSITVPVKVEEIPVTKISFSQKEMDLGLKTSQKMAATFEPANATKNKITYKSSNTGIVTVSDDGTLTGVALGTATITATAESGVKAELKVTVLFNDVMDNSQYYYKPVYWAANEGITKGYDDGAFGAKRTCTRGEMVMFLWRLCGKPTPVTSKNPFPDVSSKAYYYKAVLWAAENEITKGYNDGTFKPDEYCKREHAVMFLWRIAGQPSPGSSKSKFKDVSTSAYYNKAVIWATEKGITNGYKEDNTFRPADNCLREHIVTFLYRYNNKGFRRTVPKLNAAPKLVSVIPTGSSHMQVTWKTVDGADGYLIYRKQGSGSWSLVGSVNSGATTTWTDSSCTYGKSYTYTVKGYWGKSAKKGGYYDLTGITAKLSYSAKYQNGYKYYYDAAGNRIENVDKIIGKQSSYIIKVNKQACVTTFYAKDGSNGYIIPVKSCICSPGPGTPTGTYYTPVKYRWKLLIGPVYGQWSTRIYGGVLFHTVYYYTNGDNTTLSVNAFNKLGSQDSMGCVRLLCEDAKWVYDNCALGTQVTIYNSSDPGPFGKPSIYRLPSWHTWDPTDPNTRYLCEKYNCH